jgi:hypothetical protein
MVVSVTFSRVSSGQAIADILKGTNSGINHGNVANGKETYPEDIYIRHNGLNEITDCKFYCQQFTGTYDGGQTALLDFDELKSWGDASASKGFLIDVNHDGVYEYNLRTSQMDSLANAVALNDASAGGSNPDDIGVGGEAHIKQKIAVPFTESVPGVRLLDFLMKFSYTS